MSARYEPRHFLRPSAPQAAHPCAVVLPAGNRSVKVGARHAKTITLNSITSLNPRGKLPRTVVVIGLVSLLNDFASEMVVPLIPLLLATGSPVGR